MVATGAVAAGAATFGILNGFWGQYSSDSLRAQCDMGIPRITLSLVNLSPENDKLTGYPGTNFAGHCGSQTFTKNGHSSNLLSHCDGIKTDIPYCQAKGTQIVLSIGGDATAGRYNVTSDAKGVEFADFLWGAFGPYNETWTGPRPFDVSETEHSSVDGFDFNLEEPRNLKKPYIAMAERFRAHKPDIFISGSPECTGDTMKEMIAKFRFDALNVQFYNNPVCSGDNNNYDNWEGVLAKSDKSKNTKIMMTFPASQDSAPGGGFIKAGQIQQYICRNKAKKNYGGVALWELSRGLGNQYKNKPFQYYVLQALKNGCTGLPTTTGGTSKPTGVPKPSPTQPGLISSCTKFYKAKSGDYCAKIVDSYGTFTLDQFIKWNPAVGKDCSGLWANTYYCVGVPGTPTSKPKPKPTATCNTKAPSPTQAKVVCHCKKWKKVNPGNTCNAITKYYKISTANFIKWNPAVGKSCSGLWANYYVCVSA